MLPAERFIQFIEQNQLFSRNDKILAAVSGGMDSVLMARLLKEAGFNFSIAHCNFQLRADEANADQQFVKELAEQLNVPFYTTNFDTGIYAAERKISIQMAARELRYQWFQQISQQNGYDRIALAHHQNDAIETILLNLTRGTGIAGMHGILPKNGNLVRPLLFLTREEIADIIKKEGISYVEDSSNGSAKYARNKLRLEVIPKLKELNPALEDTFGRNLGHFRNLEILLTEKLAEVRKALFEQHENSIHISIDGIKQLHPRQFLLFGLLQEYGFNESTVEDIISILDKHPGRMFESETHTIVLDRQKLILTGKQDNEIAPVPIDIKDREARFGHYQLNILHDDSPLIVKDNSMAASVDTEKLIYPLAIRSWQQSDFFHPLGMKAKKKLSDFFIGEKVPLNEKKQVPLLVNGNGDIIWIGGYRLDDRYKVTPKTKKVTIFELYKT